MRTLTLMAASCCWRPAAPRLPAGRQRSDAHGCRASAGYQWSPARPVRTAVRTGGAPAIPRATETGSAFVLFNPDQSKAELTLPSGAS